MLYDLCCLFPCLSICLSVRQQYYAKTTASIFMKLGEKVEDGLSVNPGNCKTKGAKTEIYKLLPNHQKTEREKLKVVVYLCGMRKKVSCWPHGKYISIGITLSGNSDIKIICI